MHVYLCINTHICIYVSIYPLIYTHQHLYIQTLKYMCTHIYIYRHRLQGCPEATKLSGIPWGSPAVAEEAHMYIYTNICLYTHPPENKYIHPPKYKYIHPPKKYIIFSKKIFQMGWGMGLMGWKRRGVWGATPPQQYISKI